MWWVCGVRPARPPISDRRVAASSGYDDRQSRVSWKGSRSSMSSGEGLRGRRGPGPRGRPTAAERRRDIDDADPVGHAPARHLGLSGGVATIDLVQKFAAGLHECGELLARVAQVVDADVAANVRYARILVKACRRSFGVVALDCAILAPSSPAPRPPAPEKPGALLQTPRTCESDSIALSFLADAAMACWIETRSAVVAFQKWPCLARDRSSAAAQPASAGLPADAEITWLSHARRRSSTASSPSSSTAAELISARSR